jgi:Leucine rich repeat
MMHDNSIVDRDASPSIVWPDNIKESQEGRPTWFVPVVATVILLMIVAIGVIIGLKPTGGPTASSSQGDAYQKNFIPKLNDLFDSCSVEDVLFKCSSKIPGLDVTVPSCIADTYYEYKSDWVLTVDPTFDKRNVSMCDPENKALMVVAYYAQNQIATETELKSIYGLTSLYFSLNGEGWINNDSWLSEKPIGEWLGVEVNEGGEVVGIRLPQVQARGVMSTFPLLPALKVLDLSSNLIEGSLPARLGKLEVLQLGYNMLSGTIPANWTKSTHLKRLQLGFNGLSGTLPSTMGKMGQLEEFDVPGNRLGSTIPSEIKGCTSLQILDLTRNMFDGTIPSEMGNLKHLEYLDLSGNSFDQGTLPVELIGLTNLVYLGLSDCSLKGLIPTAIGDISNLSYLELDGNKFHGPIPSEIGLLTNMIRMDLELNRLNGTIPSEIGGMAYIEGIDFSLNLLTGTLPTELGRLLKIESFLFASNTFDGDIPDEICNLWQVGKLQDLGDVSADSGCELSVFGGAACPYQECCQNCPGLVH